MTQDNPILSPDEVKEIRQRRPERKIAHTSDKYFNRGGKVVINYESMGRFSIPENLYFKDYDIEDINNFTFSRQEDLLENVMFTLNKSKNEDANCSVGDMVPEEFLETLLGMNLQFSNGKEHKHPWLCECQSSKSSDEQQINEMVIDLSTINYTPIVEADRLIKEYFMKEFETMTEEEWAGYLNTKYKDNPVDPTTFTKEQEVETIIIKEPIIQEIEGKRYAFRLARMNDVLKGQKQAIKKFSGKLKTIESQKVPTPELKQKRDEEINLVKEERDKYSILYSQAMSLLSVDGIEFKSDEERFLVYKSISRNDLFDLINFRDQFKFGVNQEIELTCPLCGKSIKRSLRQEISSIELLPLDSDSKGASRNNKPAKIFIGL